MKYLILTLCLPFMLFANSLQEGAFMQPLVIKDQHEKNVIISADTKEIIVAFTQAQGTAIKAFLEANPNYLAEHHAVYLMDATAVPSMVMSIFMMPKFKKYPYSIGLLEKEKDVAVFPKKEERMTVLSLDKFKITNVSFKESL